jgi:hypothetical protein
MDVEACPPGDETARAPSRAVVNSRSTFAFARLRRNKQVFDWPGDKFVVGCGREHNHQSRMNQSPAP